MNTTIKVPHTATVEEAAKVLGMKADFVAAAEMTPAERGNAVRDFQTRALLSLLMRNTVLTGLSVSSLGVLLTLLKGPQLDHALMMAVAPAALFCAFIDARNKEAPLPRAEIQTRSQTNTMMAYNAMKAATANPSPPSSRTPLRLTHHPSMTPDHKLPTHAAK